MIICRSCGAPFASQGNGIGPLCLGCLLDSALANQPDAPGPVGKDARGSSTGGKPFAGPHFAHYQIVTREDGAFVELGHGGMGVTYRAIDTTLHRDVALKVVRPDFIQNERFRARFLREARAAAGLRHPHVASVFFFGERAEDGQLFYAMELVEGETLHARVRRCGGLPTEQVLEIGVQVADALAAAEARGLTHRDLKPANLMLAEGDAVNVKIIDFGLAKAAAGEHAQGPALTQTQDFVGTPAFASPEHFNVWQEVDARSDFYALGATLWFALTGQPPFAGRVPQEMRAEQMRATLPLEQLAAARVPLPVVELLRSLLSPDPAGRPQTARALATALAGCRQMPHERLSRNQDSKHMWGTRTLTVTFGALALAAGWWAVSRHDTGDIARQNALLQRQTLAQQQQLSLMQDQLKQQTQLIALVNAKIDRNAAPAGVNPTESNPAASAQAEVARERGISIETLQKQLAGEQVDVRQILARVDQHLAAARAETAQWQGLKRAALTRLGEGEYAAGHYLAAIEPYQQALALADPDKEPLAWCDAAHSLETVFWQAARYAEAAPLLQQTVDRRRALQGSEHPATLKAEGDQANLFLSQGKYVEAEALFRRVLAAQERILGKENPDTLHTLSNLSYLLHYRGKDAEAETLGRRCLEACERTLGKDNLNTLQSANDLASTLYYEGNHAESASLNRRCLEARERILGPNHPDTIKSVNNLAISLMLQGDLKGSEALNRRALAAQEQAMGPDHPMTLTILHNLGSLLQDEKDYPSAESYTRRALEGRERILGPDHSDTLMSLSSLAQVLDAKGDLAAAEPIYQQAATRMEHLLPPQDDIRLDLEHFFSLFRENQGRLSEALALAAQVADGCKGLPESSPLRQTYEQHFQHLQAKVRTSQFPTPTPARKMDVGAR